MGRRSARVLKEQKDNISDRMDNLNKLRSFAERARSDIEKGSIDSFGEMLNESWQAKRSLASGVSTDTLDNYYKSAIEAGATGGKILGAGGGGFFMFYCDENRQDSVRKALSPMREVAFDFPGQGSTIIFNDRRKTTGKTLPKDGDLHDI